MPHVDLKNANKCLSVWSERGTTLMYRGELGPVLKN